MLQVCLDVIVCCFNCKPRRSLVSYYSNKHGGGGVLKENVSECYLSKCALPDQDMVNRRISMDMMLKVAASQRYRQFVFLTPQNMR